MGGALSFTRKSEDLPCWHRVFWLPCGYMSQQWGVPLVSRKVRGSSTTSANLAPRPSSCRGLAVGCVLAGGVPLWAVSPLVVFPPAVFGGCAPSGSLSRIAASFLPCLCLCSLASPRLADLPATNNVSDCRGGAWQCGMWGGGRVSRHCVRRLRRSVWGTSWARRGRRTPWGSSRGDAGLCGDGGEERWGA